MALASPYGVKSKRFGLAFKSLLWSYLSVPTVFPAKPLQTLPILGLCPGRALGQPHSAATRHIFGGLAKCPLLPLTLSPIRDVPLQKPNQANQSRKLLLLTTPWAFHLLSLPPGNASLPFTLVWCTPVLTTGFLALPSGALPTGPWAGQCLRRTKDYSIRVVFPSSYAN